MFKHVTEALLSGQFICPTAFPDAFDYLSKAENFSKVDAFLSQLDRELCMLEGEEIYYAAYAQIDNDNRSQIKETFSEIRSQLRPVVEWMDMVMTAMGQDMPIRARDEIRMHKLLKMIELEPSLCEQMNRLTQTALFKTSKTTINDQLSWILQKLEQCGYLVKPNPQGGLYIVTGKMNYLHQIIAFLNDAEELELDKQANRDENQQQGLFS
ncbi:MAG: condensin complex protein MksE [Methylobacter sp.]